MRLADLKARSPHEVSHAISLSRRNFLRTVTGAGAASAFFGPAALHAMAVPKNRKAVVVTFGGGARDDETFMPDGQENIPHLLNELIPQATFLTNVVNQGILGHYVATASIVTGVYETFNNFASVSPNNPTVFEYFRKDLKRPATDAWVVAPSNGFARIGESANKLYGPGLGAGVIPPKRLARRRAFPSVPAAFATNTSLRDNYETPLYAPSLAGHQIELDQMAEVLKLSVDDFAAHARNLVSPDELSVYIARQLMRQLFLAFYGSRCTTSTSPTPALSRSISTASNGPTASAPNSGRVSRKIPNTRTKRTCSSCRISAAIPTSIPAVTASSITAPAMLFHVRHG